jgi:hypothetical protein
MRMTTLFFSMVLAGIALAAAGWFVGGRSQRGR